MNFRIRQLPLSIANQIAAGEVIERPASVVKELLENAVDAGATQIGVDIVSGGLNQIKVSDNGHGICAEDLPLAIAPHATSKILTVDDLYAIESMGFRGEALASIASVSKLSISSKTQDQTHAMMLQTEMGEGISLSPCARACGTTVDVVDLFFNTPVRKRFLKSEKLEFQAIEQVVKRFALSVPAVELSLRHHAKEILHLPKALNEKARLDRISKIFGRSFVNEAIFLEAKNEVLSVCAWLGGPESGRSQNDRQWVYVNGRMVKDRLIQHALRQVYEDLLHPGRFPAYLLYLTIDKTLVDVNVHPTKHELRFQAPRAVHDFLSTQLFDALSTAFVEQKTSVSLKREEPEVQTSFDFLQMAEVHQKQQWIVLNQQYLIVFWQNTAYLVDGLYLQQHRVYCQLKHSSLPLLKRMLLVPVYLSYQQINGQGLQEYGFDIDLLPEGGCVVRAIPTLVPHLDLTQFLDAVSDEWSQEEVLRCLSQSQHMDLASFSPEEQAVCLEYLMEGLEKNDLPKGLCKPLSLEQCQQLMRNDL
jgi:DNA mismatch repair protein MutL